MILTGLARLGRDTEVRFTSSGDAVANLSLAFNYGRPGQDGKKPTQWVEAGLWGKRAESLSQHLTKGTALDVIVGDVHIETYQAKDGTTGTKLVGRVIELEFAGSGKQDNSHPSGQTDHGRAKADGYAPAPKPASKPAQSFDDLGDDIPF